VLRGSTAPLFLGVILFTGFLLPALAMTQLTAEATTPIPTDTIGPTLHVPNPEPEVLLSTGSTGDNTGYAVRASDNVDGTARLDRYGTLTQDEVGGDIIISCNPPSGSVRYPVGDHTVRCRATDSDDNSAQAAFTIKIRSFSFGGGDPSTIKAFVSANPANYEGPCPVVIPVTATVTGVGPLKVAYRWTDSDGYLGSTITTNLIVDKVWDIRTWTLGDINVQPTYQGWMALEIVEPVQLYSNVAWVSITCTSAAAAPVLAGAGGTNTTAPTLTQSGGVQINHLDDNTASVGYQVTAQDDVDGTATLDVNNMLSQDTNNVGGSITISCNPASGSVLPIGDHTVQCSATDASGEQGTVSFTVSVPRPATSPAEPTLQAPQQQQENTTTTQATATDEGGGEEEEQEDTIGATDDDDAAAGAGDTTTDAGGDSTDGDEPQ
jgi:hypothetical protein